MAVWEQTALVTALCVAGAFAVAEVIRRAVPALSRLGLPGSILAGCLALAAGPQWLEWLPVDQSVLELVVYHGLALVFIAVALTPPDDRPEGEAAASGGLSMAFAIVSMVTLQTIAGVLIVLCWGLLTDAIHPGMGLLLPLGFEQGPGQAMAMGSVWEPALQDGAQLGLIIASIGFAWSVLFGVPLVMLGRARGWGTTADPSDAAGGVMATERAPAGGMDILTAQLVAVSCVYAATLGLCHLLSLGISMLDADIGKMVWGFHFIVGALIATGVRPLLLRLHREPFLHAGSLRRIAGTSVDITTASALAAVQLAVFAEHWMPLMLLTTLGGVLTLAWVLYIAPRAFPDAPFEHALVWFGMSTGTLPMGLALLRVVDPELRSPAPVSAVIGSAGATLGSIPVVLVIHPAIASTWPDSFPTQAWVWTLVALAYFVVVVGLWRGLGPLRFRNVSWGRQP